jgi:hypothetical protein
MSDDNKLLLVQPKFLMTTQGAQNTRFLCKRSGKTWYLGDRFLFRINGVCQIISDTCGEIMEKR